MERKNKVSLVLAGILFALSLCLAFGVKYVFHACPLGMGHDGKIMPCHWAEQAIFAVGIVLSVMSLLLFIFKKAGEKAAISASMVPVTIMALLLPQIIIKLCMMPEMACRVSMRPAVIGVSIALLIVEVVSIIINLKKENRK
nr:DUF4418 family protein [uncultured Catonella sp.]